MSTATDELVEVDVDLDKTPPCEAEPDDCDKPAAWRMKVLCPVQPQTFLLCETHHRNQVTWWTIVGLTGRIVQCHRHGKAIVPPPYYESRPL